MGKMVVPLLFHIISDMGRVCMNEMNEWLATHCILLFMGVTKLIGWMDLKFNCCLFVWYFFFLDHVHLVSM